MQFKLKEPSWNRVLKNELASFYMQDLSKFIEEQRKEGKKIYPCDKNIFKAFELCSFDHVKVVILGQDPYHQKGQAHGLCFSVAPGIKVPPSLRNIYKELHSDLGIPISENGHLENWAKQGVLLLNAVLTVEEGRPGLHAKKGWEQFTDKVIQILSEQKQGIVFVLWGNYAQKKGAKIDESRHLVIKGVHPSPLSASRGFFGKRYFSKINNYLKDNGKGPISYQ